jgi:hypothetical protein
MDSLTLFIEAANRRFGPFSPGSPRSGPTTWPGRRPRPGTGPSVPSDDFASNISTTGLLTPGVPVSGTIEVAFDSDWFKKVLQVGKTYQFSLDGVTLGDPILAIRDSNGRLIQENDDRKPGSNLNSQIIFTPSASGTYFLDVRSFESGTGTYRLIAEEVTALPPAPAPASGFQIDVDYSGDPSFLGFFTEAAQRWSQIISADVPDFGGVDDLLISVTIADIDGVGGTLGQAGPDALRPSSLGSLPYTGSTELDAADVANLASKGTLDDVVLHEFGHILGIGTIWDTKGLRSGTNYVGFNAIREFNTIGGSGNTVPLEPNGGPGTALSHWAEDVFGDELMTGFLSGSTNPLSKVTVGTLNDLGYAVNYSSADSFSLSSFLRAGDTYTVSSSIEITSMPRSAVPSGTPDVLIDGSSSCFCGTCSSLALGSFELGQFSSAVSASAQKVQLAPSRNDNVQGVDLLDVTPAASLKLPSYLSANPLERQLVQDLVASFVPAYLVTD